MVLELKWEKVRCARKEEKRGNWRDIGKSLLCPGVRFWVDKDAADAILGWVVFGMTAPLSVASPMESIPQARVQGGNCGISKWAVKLMYQVQTSVSVSEMMSCRKLCPGQRRVAKSMQCWRQLDGRDDIRKVWFPHLRRTCACGQK